MKGYEMYFFKSILRRIKIHEVVSMRIAKNLMYGYVFPIFFSATCTDFSMVKMPPRNIWIRLFSCALQTTTTEQTENWSEGRSTYNRNFSHKKTVFSPVNNYFFWLFDFYFMLLFSADPTVFSKDFELFFLHMKN